MTDRADFSWPHTAGVMIERQQKETSVITLNGVPKLTETVLQINRGANYFNRVYDLKSTLAEFELESFFVRIPEKVLANTGPDPTGNPVEIQADQFVHPSTGEHYENQSIPSASRSLGRLASTDLANPPP